VKTRTTSSTSLPPIAHDALDQIAIFYGEELDRLRMTSGESYLTPERIVVRVLDKLLTRNGTSLHWCEGYGKESACHLWARPQGAGIGEFDHRCEAHPERRLSERRGS
jgi:hypothetical protein